jgi:Ca2+-binding EF-hand superfamily protein
MNTMIYVEQQVVKIQAKFRQQLALKMLEKQNELDRQKLERKGPKRGFASEEEALKHFRTRLEKKGLTPEGFFRLCDLEYKKTITVEAFKRQAVKMKLGLTKGQLARIALILDENMEQNITLQEFYYALEAFGQSSEEHFAVDGSEVYIGFQQRAMFKLMDILGEKGISYIELFRMCDVSRDQVISVKELQDVLMNLSAELLIKEVQAIYTYFDIDSNDQCSQKEFMHQFLKAE